jgi:hypothetical protein
MKEKVVKCPMCGFPKGEACDLMVKKTEEKDIICCCERLQNRSVIK